MDKELIKHLQKCNTPENFYKLCMFVAEAAGEGIGINNCDAGDLLYLDVLSEQDGYVYDNIAYEAEEFTKTYNT